MLYQTLPEARGLDCGPESTFGGAQQGSAGLSLQRERCLLGLTAARAVMHQHDPAHAFLTRCCGEAGYAGTSNVGHMCPALFGVPASGSPC